MQEEDVDVNVLRLVIESGRKWSALRRKPANIGGASLLLWVELVVVVTNALGCGLQQMGVFFRPDFLAWVCSCEWWRVRCVGGYGLSNKSCTAVRPHPSLTFSGIGESITSVMLFVHVLYGFRN